MFHINIGYDASKPVMAFGIPHSTSIINARMMAKAEFTSPTLTTAQLAGTADIIVFLTGLTSLLIQK